MQKQILWSAIPEKFNLITKTWENGSLYRANIITSRKDLERLIWNAENDL